MTTRIIIDERRFRRLVAGEPIIERDVEVVIASPPIGWVKMVRAVLDAIAPAPGNAPSDPPQAREFLPNRYTRRPDGAE